jgi:hypothetical protein
VYTPIRFSRILDFTLAAPVPASSFQAETTAWIAEVVSNGGSVSAGRKIIVDNLIVSLKADSLWTKLDRLWLFAAEDEPSALTDLVGLDLATAVSSPSFVADEGYTGNGSTSYIDSNFNPSTASSPKFVQDSAAIGIYDRTDRTGADLTIMMGIRGAAAAELFPLSDAGPSGRFEMNGGGTPFTESNANAKGSYLVSRTASDLTTAYKNGASLGTDTAASVGVANLDFFICSGNNGSAFLPATDQAAGAWIGEGFDATTAANFATHINTYMTAVGANVY